MINDKRQASLIAARRGDFRAVAKLTTEVARLNQELHETRPTQDDSSASENRAPRISS